jgi:glycosyltransferase involved in cell wall biosynthesis
LPDPLVTIVIPTRNRNQLVLRALNSALAQSFRDAEVIVVDDASSAPVQLPALAQDIPVRVLRHERALGPCAARNRGLAEARGRWITFLDDDDELLPEGLQISLDAIRSSPLTLPVSALSGIDVVDSGTGRLVETRVPITINRGDSFFRADADGNSFQDVCTLFAPVDVMKSIGGWDEALKGWESEDMLLRVTQVSSLQGVPQPTYRLHVHGGERQHQNARAMLEGGLRTMSKYPDAFAADPQRRAKYLRALGLLYLRLGEWQPAVRALVASLRLDPHRPRSWRLYVRALVDLVLARAKSVT